MNGKHVLAAALVTATHLIAPAGVSAADVDCLIQPRQTVLVSAPVEGRLESVSFDRGDTVERGQVLARLDMTAERAAAAVAKARAEMESPIQSGRVRVDFGIRRWERTEAMYRKELIPLKEMDEAETAKVLAEHGLIEAQENKTVAEREYDRAQAALDLRLVRSPISGVVHERMRNPGEYTAKESPIAKIVQLDPLYVEVYAPLEMSRHLRVGQRALVMSELQPNRPLEATVTVVDRVMDAASGTFGVRLEVPNPGNVLPAGLKCKARFSLPK